MRYVFYSPYLDSFGGGERYLATAAEFFSKFGKVVIFWDNEKILPQLESRFNLNLKKVKILPNVFEKNLFKRFQVLKKFDLVFILSDGSIPAPFAKRNILHFQEPFRIDGHNFKNKLKFKRYIVICNSKFTKKYIDQSFGINSSVVYPPVDVNFFVPLQKEKIILSVGRFLEGGQGKKQEVLIETFKSLITNHQSPITNNWQLWLAGGVFDKKYFELLQKKAANLPIKFFPDNNALQLKKLYSQAAIYWHAKGFGEDVVKNPQFAEHFGISIVEAQSSGAVPVVFDAGGVREIISDGETGFFWKTQEELLQGTESLISNSNLVRKMQEKAIVAAKKFSKEIFFSHFQSLINI